MDRQVASALAAHGLAIAGVLLLLIAVGQPIFTDDVWWHLAMGRRYAQAGPWLDADALLHTSQGPIAPSAWLSDVWLHAGLEASGFTGLRTLHVGLVVGVLAMGWAVVRRAGGSRPVASAAVLVWACLSAYRVVQLRPHLFSMLLAFAVVWLVIMDRRRGPGPGPIALLCLLVALWANLHAAFVLGPALLGAAAAGSLVASAAVPDPDGAERRRGLALLLACGATLLASLLNPIGPAALAHYFVAGQATPALELVGDEWASTRLFAWPLANLPPSPVNWALAWMLTISVPVCILTELRRRRAAPDGEATIDPALAGMAVLALIALISAVRFLWLGLIPLALLGQWLSGRSDRQPLAALALPLGMLALLVASGRHGDWPMVSRNVARATYAQPYSASKYHAHAIWLLADAGLEGRLFNNYFMGNFAGYWLSPQLPAFVNGSLNLPPESLRDSRALLERRGGAPGERYLDTLDRHGVDVFIGTGVPRVSRANRPIEYTADHLQGAPGWIPVFRNMQSALYLRDHARNRQNLARLAEHYAEEGVPFDPERGFDVRAVIEEAPRWATAHGMIPPWYAKWQRDSVAGDPPSRAFAAEQLATLFVLLGDYERVVRIDRRLARRSDPSPLTLRRLCWALMRLGEYAESREVARRLDAARSAGDRLSALVADRALATEGADDEAIRSRDASLPLFRLADLDAVFGGFVPPQARSARRVSPPRAGASGSRGDSTS